MKTELQIWIIEKQYYEIQEFVWFIYNTVLFFYILYTNWWRLNNIENNQYDIAY